MFRNEETLLQYHYKRNPKLQEIMDNLDKFSLEEIENCSLDKWIRIALSKAKIKMKAMNFIETNVIESVVDDVLGEIFRWIGEERFIYFGKSQILIKPNDLFFVTKKGIWLDTVFTNKYDPKLNQYSPVKSATFTEYKNFRQNDLQSRMPHFDKLLPVLGENLTTKPAQTFSIYRLP